VLRLCLGFFLTFTRVRDESKRWELTGRGVVCDRFGGCFLHRGRNDFSISFQSCGGKEEEEEEEKYDDNNNEFALLRCIERRRDGVVGTSRSPLLLVLLIVV
tara:strand:- start:316 stop:621 length:306 start_codon:yes stop_codon:yes gene_type:complete